MNEKNIKILIFNKDTDAGSVKVSRPMITGWNRLGKSFISEMLLKKGIEKIETGKFFSGVKLIKVEIDEYVGEIK